MKEKSTHRFSRRRTLLLITASLWLGCGAETPSASVDAGGSDAVVEGGTPDTGVVDDASARDTGTFDDANVTECAPVAPTPPDAVLTDRGRVRGVSKATTAGTVVAYLGIPYAAPPTEALRWRPPAEASCWSGVLEASAFGHVCPQLEDNVVIGDEDCLTLNVWRPESADATQLRPVMVWIHGGGNQLGSSAESRYDGATLAATTGAIVVSLNYRLGALGFLASAALRAESDHDASGNYGIHDQIAALGWVQRNVAQFGGDGSRVTVFGQSAGAQNVWVLLASPLARGLFARAVAHSGLGLTSTSTEVEAIGTEIGTAIGCAGVDALQCLRAKPFDEVTAAVPGEGGVGQRKVYVPNVDGWVLEATPLQTILDGRHNRVPLIAGTTSEETMFDFGAVPDEATYRSMAHTFYDARYGATVVDEALALYSVSAFGAPRAALVALTTDQRFVCPLEVTLKLLDGAQDEPIYRYVFSYPSESLLAGRVSESLRPFGAFHLWDLYFVFQTFETLANGTYQSTAADRMLAAAVGGYWGRFATTADPNGASAPTWPLYSATDDPYLDLNVSISAASHYRADRCAFWSGR